MGNVRTALLVVVLALALSRIVLSAVGVVKGRLATAIGAGLTCRLRKDMVQKLSMMDNKVARDYMLELLK